MIPKTQLQRLVVALSAKLQPITEKQELWGYEKCFTKYFVRSRLTTFCLECGHSWKENSTPKLIAPVLTFDGLITAECTCPNCGRNLKMIPHYSPNCRDSSYLAILSTKEDMQVVRMFYVNKTMKKGQKAKYFTDEVMQHWIDRSGKVTTMSKTVMGLSYYYDQWIFSSSLEVRFYKNCKRYDIDPNWIYPERKILPELKRNGFKGNFHGFTPHTFFSIILRADTHAETLLKSGQIEMLKYCAYINEQHWTAIKICIRNGYEIKDASMWIDYIDLLIRFGKDIHNPKFVCPENLHLVHDKLVRKKQEADQKIWEAREAERQANREEDGLKRLVEMRKRIESQQKAYAKAKGKFFDMLFTEGELFVKPLESVEEFYLEGNKLNHCVYANDYFTKKDSLILSARIDHTPIETIEVSLSNFKIIQARGLNNKPSQYHNQIINLVQNNMPKIAKKMAVAV